MSELQKRIDDECKSVQWRDIFTPQERQEYIDLNEKGEKEKAEELFQMALKREKSNLV